MYVLTKEIVVIIIWHTLSLLPDPSARPCDFVSLHIDQVTIKVSKVHVEPSQGVLRNENQCTLLVTSKTCCFYNQTQRKMIILKIEEKSELSNFVFPFFHLTCNDRVMFV